MLGSYYREQAAPVLNKKIVLGASGLLAVLGLLGVFVFSATGPQVSSLVLAHFELEEAEFQYFVQKHGKEYADDEEYLARFKTYSDNAAFIRLFNTQGKNWTLGINQFADLSFEEFKSLYSPNSYQRTETEAEAETEYERVTVPGAIDWRKEKAVTNVKNQGQCGSCWSFSAAGAVEGAWAIAGHGLVSLSEQQLMDCSTSFGNQGCNGGLMDNAFKYVEKFGLTSLTNYPYTAADGTCKQDKVANVTAHITGYKDVARSNSDALVAAIAKTPVAVAVEADQWMWQFYNGGVIDSGCGERLDHGVLAVGYDTTVSPQFYWVKNSWGAQWGLAGYIKLGIKSGAGVCGIQVQPSYPII